MEDRKCGKFGWNGVEKCIVFAGKTKEKVPFRIPTQR
jgi:hypothetical protein